MEAEVSGRSAARSLQLIDYAAWAGRKKRGRKMIAKTMPMTNAPADGTSQMACQLWVVGTHCPAAAAAAVHAELTVA